MAGCSSLLSDRGYAALAEFRYAICRFLAFSERAARAAGLEPRQHQALLAVKGFGGRRGLAIKDLAERLQLRHNTAVELADRMARLGLVRRAPDAADGRVVLLRLTRRGEARLASLTAVHREELARVGPELRRRLGRVLVHARRG